MEKITDLITAGRVLKSLEKLEQDLGVGKSKIGVTRKDKSPNKKAVKRAKNSRKTNFKRANKKFRPTGSKQRK